MAGTNFLEIAARDERDSLVQKSAAEKLLGLLDCQRDDRVLDVAAFREIVARSFRKQAGEDGQVALTFSRIYIVGRRQA
jgi:hypothetical protein